MTARIAQDAGWADPAGFGVQCRLLWDGVIAGVHVGYTADPVEAACQAVDALIAVRKSTTAARKIEPHGGVS